MSKLNKLEISIKETGELIENGKAVVENIIKEDRLKLIKSLCWKIENKPFEMTLDELEAYRIMVKKKRGKTVKYKLDAGEFITLMIQDLELIKKLNIETKSMLYEISMITNKSGILLYKNNKPISSFEKLKLYLEIGHSKWSKIKEDVDKYDIIIKRKDKNDRNILIINPLFSTNSTEVTEMKFIVFGHLLKEKMDFDDYLYLCKRYEIIPEYEPQNQELVLSQKELAQTNNDTI